MSAVERLTADSILKRGVRFQIPAPLFLRLLGKKKSSVNITQLCYGAELKIARLSVQLTQEPSPEKPSYTDQCRYMLENYKTVIRIVALSTLNRKHIPFLLMWIRTRQLKRLTVWQLFEMFSYVKEYSGCNPFMSITRLALITRVTRPNLGQEMSGG